MVVAFPRHTLLPLDDCLYALQPSIPHLTDQRCIDAYSGTASPVCPTLMATLILGKAGLLRGYRATSHWSCRDALAGFGAIPTDARVVRDRNRITGAGVTSGLYFGLTMVAELRDRTNPECTQLMSEYDPQPPFDAGSMKTAPAGVKAQMERMVGDFRREARALAAES